MRESKCCHLSTKLFNTNATKYLPKIFDKILHSLHNLFYSNSAPGFVPQRIGPWKIWARNSLRRMEEQLGIFIYRLPLLFAILVFATLFFFSNLMIPLTDITSWICADILNQRIISYNGSSINDVTQFRMIFNPHPPLSCFSSNKAYILSSLNLSPPLRTWRHLRTNPNRVF